MDYNDGETASTGAGLLFPPTAHVYGGSAVASPMSSVLSSAATPSATAQSPGGTIQVMFPHFAITSIRSLGALVKSDGARCRLDLYPATQHQ